MLLEGDCRGSGIDGWSREFWLGVVGEGMFEGEDAGSEGKGKLGSDEESLGIENSMKQIVVNYKIGQEGNRKKV